MKSKMTRREFLSVSAGTTLALAAGCVATKTKTGNTTKKPGPVKMLEGADIPKFKERLVIPPVMPSASSKGGVTHYEIAVKQFDQQILPKTMPKTTVWGYGRAGDPLPGTGKPSTFNYPAFTIETRSNATVTVDWINGLVDPGGSFLPPLTPVDQTIHWAAPMGMPTADMKTKDPMPYKGPVPIVTHLHGAHAGPESDGYPVSWYLPDAKNIPAGYMARGANYTSTGPEKPGSARYTYPNSQPATTLWYHDHALGMTRNNVYCGLSGFWIIRDDAEDGLGLPGPAPKLGDKAKTDYYEIPIVIQDRTFNSDGSLFYPDSRAFFDEYKGPYIPDTNVPPIWNPEFFGNTMVVNGRTWPYLEVQPKKYRFRILNGCGSRFLRLKFDREGLSFILIGTDGGLMPDAPVALGEILAAPAERFDVIVDFSAAKAGDEIMLLNTGPDEPFKGLAAEIPPSDPKTTGQVMKFKVTAKKGADSGATPAALPAIARLTTDLPSRELIIQEEMNEELDVPVSSHLGTGANGPLEFFSPITERPFVNDTEIWEIVNLTEDAHPIHLHQVMFQVIDRQPFDKEAYNSAMEDQLQKGEPRSPLVDFLSAPPNAPHAWETGLKDTVIVDPGMVTRIIARFDIVGLYVWHCHILEHEDNEMMRPYEVVAR